MQRFPKKSRCDIHDFRRIAWHEIGIDADHQDYPSLWQKLSVAALKAIDGEDLPAGRVLWLLADACSLVLSPKSVNEPFKPISWSGRRSILSDDFGDAESLALFEAIGEEVKNDLVKARVAEISWLLAKPRRLKQALLALDSYQRLPIDLERWAQSGRDCCERSIILTKILGRGAEDRLVRIETSLVAALERAEVSDGYLSLWISELLFEHDLATKDSFEIAARLEQLGYEFEVNGELRRAGDCFSESAKWYRRSEDMAQLYRVASLEASTWAKQAEIQSQVKRATSLPAVTFLERAIQIYRRIPKSERSRLEVDERLEELQLRLREAGEKSLREMGVASSGSIDLSESAQHAQKLVKGKNAVEALLVFVNLYPGARVKQLRSMAEENLRSFPLRTLFSSTHMTKDGRVIARPNGDRSGFGEDREALVWSEMITHYSLSVALAVQGLILPALETLTLEHRLLERDFASMVLQSPIVPEGRVNLFAKGLFLGYDRDFVGAVHLLVPQIENLVRQRLRSVNCKTSTISSDGIETENGLSTLVMLPEFPDQFGEDLGFELRAFFCDPLGPNLRNEVAHGLLSDSVSKSVNPIYAWWLILRMIYNTFWNARSQEPVPGERANNQDSRPDLGRIEI